MMALGDDSSWLRCEILEREQGPNRRGSCTTGVNPVAPVISSVSAQGTGIGTVIALQGDFGDDPGSNQDIANRIAEVDGRMYVRVAVTDVNGKFRWGAGLPGISIPGQVPNAVRLNILSWTKTGITLQFGAGYSGGNTLYPGDQIKVTVFSPANGQSATSDVITLPVSTVIALVKPSRSRRALRAR